LPSLFFFHFLQGKSPSQQLEELQLRRHELLSQLRSVKTDSARAMSTVAEIVGTMSSKHLYSQTAAKMVSNGGYSSSSVPTVSSTTYSTPSPTIHSLHMGDNKQHRSHSANDVGSETALTTSDYNPYSSWHNSPPSMNSQVWLNQLDWLCDIIVLV
jgi:hypothetical protein